MKKIAVLALLTAVSLVLYVVELQIPPLIPQIPGIKTGLANIVTLFILFGKPSNDFKAHDALLVVIARVVLSGLITGSMFAMMFSLSGGVISTVVMAALRRALPVLPPPVVSVAGALTHNFTQITVAAFIFGGLWVLVYLPALVLSGIASGLITGFAAAIIIRRLSQ